MSMQLTFLIYHQFNYFLHVRSVKGFLPNSMIHGGRVVSFGHTCYAYAVCDPRAAQVAPTSSDAMESTRDCTSSVCGLESKYRRVVSYRGKQRKNLFDYHSLNVSLPCDYYLLLLA